MKLEFTVLLAIRQKISDACHNIFQHITQFQTSRSS